ncbi:MAG: DUF4852 domain-containing protein [Alphaproteobacteria bacterium]|nr:DUF4852 domain-containing protein [Alphaproteobacteria bacterium]
MKIAVRLAVFGLVVLSCFVGLPAHAETYEKPAMDNIMRSLVRFGAIDINDDMMLDLYARVNACDLYRQFYQDEFKWREIRTQMRKVIKEEAATYPTGYRYDTQMQLGRYDFEKKSYPFVHKEQNSGVNAFRMITHDSDFCTDEDMYGFPRGYRLVLASPIDVPDLPLKEEEAKALLKRMDEDGNKDHIVTARFNIRVVFIASLMPNNVSLEQPQEGGKTMARVRQRIQTDSIILDSRLDSIEFYEDPERTKLIYVYRP